MANRINSFPQWSHHPQPIIPQQPSKVDKAGKGVQPAQGSGSAAVMPDFSQVLKEKMNVPSTSELKFSAHAERRLESRHIQFSNNELEKLGEAVDQAAAKGSQDSLVLLGDVGLVVSVKNRTVVTAVDGDSMNGNVFTNIDSVVVVKE